MATEGMRDPHIEVLIGNETDNDIEAHWEHVHPREHIPLLHAHPKLHVGFHPHSMHEQMKRRQPGERKPFHHKLFKTPKETCVAILQTSINKSELPLDKLFLLSFFSGVFVSLGGIFALSVYLGTPSLDVGLRKLLFGLTFPVGLVFIILFGGELFTGNTMIMTVGLAAREISIKSYFLNLAVSFSFNFAGCVFGGAFFGYFTELFATEPYLSGLTAFALAKVTLPFQVVFLRAISANFLVNLGFFSAMAAESVEGKILGSFVAITTFATSSFEHCIANMFFVSCGLMYGAEFTFWDFLYRNLLLAAVGNFIGGGLFLGLTAWWAYLRNTSYPPLKKRKGDITLAQT